MIFSKYGALHAARGNIGTTQLVAVALGVETFPNGVPYLCFEHDLYPRDNEFGGAGQPLAQIADVRSATPGWLLAPQGAAVPSSK